MQIYSIIKYSIDASIVSGVILAVKLIFNKKIPASCHYFIWLILLIRLAAPILPQTNISLFNIINTDMQTRQVSGIIDSAQQSGNAVNSDADAVSSSNAGTNYSVNYNNVNVNVKSAGSSAFPTFLEITYICGAIATLLFFMITYICLLIKLKELPVNNYTVIRDLYDNCSRKLKLKRKVNIIISDSYISPMLVGFILPKLVIPDYVITQLEYGQLECIIFHELIHLKRMDVVVNWLITIFRCIHWFNPVMWFVFTKIQRDCESACDAKVLSIVGEKQRMMYGETLISIAERRNLPVK